MKKQKTNYQRKKKSDNKGFIGRSLLYIVAPIVGSLFIYLVLHAENRTLYKDIALMEEQLGALQNILEVKVAEVQKLESEDRIIGIAQEKIGMVRIDMPSEQLFVSQEKINRIKKIVKSKYE